MEIFLSNTLSHLKNIDYLECIRILCMALVVGLWGILQYDWLLARERGIGSADKDLNETNFF